MANKLPNRTHLLMWLIAKKKMFKKKKTIYWSIFELYVYRWQKMTMHKKTRNWAFPHLFWRPLKFFAHLKGFRLSQVYVKMWALQRWLISFGAYIIACFFPIFVACIIWWAYYVCFENHENIKYMPFHHWIN
jgi:hypothetical protein